MIKEYPMFVVISGKDVRLNILTDCPLYDQHGGLCSKCIYYLGIDSKILHEGRCGVAVMYKNIEEFKSCKHCPNDQERKKGGDCHHCEHFLGFVDNRGFYCASLLNK